MRRSLMVDAVLGRAKAPPYFDDFSGASATITGRAVRDKVWADSNGASPVVPGNPIITDGSGCITGNQGSLPANHMTTLDCGTFAEWWCRRRNNPGQAAIGFTIENADHVTQTGVNTWTKVGLIYTTAGLSGAVQWGYNNGGTATGSLTVIAATQQSSTQVVLGDSLETEYVAGGGTWTVNGYHNGRLILSGLSMASFTGAKSGVFGFNGRLAATAGSLNVSAFEDIRIGDPNQHAMLRVFCPQRVIQRNADSTITPKFTLTYSKGPPRSIKVTLFNASTKVAVGNFTSISAAIVNIGGNQITLTLPTIAAADIPATFYFQFEWSGADVSSGATIYAHTPILRAGEITGCYGQSLCQFMWSDAMTAGVSTAAGWLYESSIVNNALLINRKVLKAQTTLAGNAMSNCMNAIATAASLDVLAVASVNGGITSTLLKERDGSATDTSGHLQALKDGITLAGGDIYALGDFGGQYEAMSISSGGFTPGTFDATAAADYVSRFNAMADKIDAHVGHAVQWILFGLGWIGGSPFGTSPTKDVQCELFRRTLWQMCQDYPSRFLEGCQTYDLNHIVGDQYHQSDDGSGCAEQARRLGKMHAYYRFADSASNRLGPKMSGLSRVNDHTVRVTYALGGASAVSAINSSTEFNGGHRFSTASSFSPLKNATSVTVIDATTIEFGFAAATFPGTVYVSGPYGQNPMNPDNDSTTDNAMITTASMIVGTYADSINIVQRPYYSNAGGGGSAQDYLSAS